MRHYAAIRLESDGTELSWWTSYNVSTDIRRLPSTTFRMTFGPVTKADVLDTVYLLTQNPAVGIYVDGTKIATGRICDIEVGGDRSRGSFVNVSGFDPLGQPALSSLPLGFSAQGTQTFSQLIESALSPWGVTVTTDNALNRAAITYRRRTPRPAADAPVVSEEDAALASAVAAGTTVAAPAQTTPESTVVETVESRRMHARPGEQVTDWILRVAEEHHLLCWATVDGGLFVGRPNYDQEPVIRIRRVTGDTVSEGTIVDARLVERYDQPTSVTVCGRVGRAGETQIRSTQTHDGLEALGWHIPKIVVDDAHGTTQATAENKAKQILREGMLAAWEYRARFAGHGAGSRMAAPDTIVEITDHVCGLEGYRAYCVARDFEMSRDNGATCEITCVRPGLWV